ncbi:MAG TPA: thiamine-phosphate kinase, partial [Alphaproteobacteria bacterium]|nr:thiamine-phosphate kinase [Alphaproteobacteria bacterium]
GLANDAATIAVPPGNELVVTKDVILAGVHFLETDPLDLVAKKLIRVNVSDLAAKGARPLGYLLACCWPKSTKEAQVAAFTRGLAEDQSVYELSLLGGDTTPTPGPLSLSMTALGLCPRGQMVHRAGARAGDLVFVTGTIGDAGLGLKIAQGEKLGVSEADAKFLLSRYRLPEPRVEFGVAARSVILASIDVSDGLVVDAGHIAEESGVGIRIEAAKLPLSSAAASWIKAGGTPLFLATCGDDYEICFTAPAGSALKLMEIAEKTKTKLTGIGEVIPGAGVQFIGRDGREIIVPKPEPTYFRAGPF